MTLSSSALAEQVLRFLGPTKNIPSKEYYFTQLLDLIMVETEAEFGPALLIERRVPMSQKRLLRSLQQQEVDILWTMTSKEREQQALAIPIPLAKGLYGFRTLVIRKEDADTFATFKQQNHLKQRLAAQGRNWPDTEILRHNGYRVENTDGYKHMYQLLGQGYADYLPRGILEVFEELDTYRQYDITIDSNHLIYYPTAIYYFVRKNDHRLAKRITLGLERLNADGRLDKLLLQHPLFAPSLKLVDWQKSDVWQLENPLLSNAAPPLDGPHWLSLADLRKRYPQ